MTTPVEVRINDLQPGAPRPSAPSLLLRLETSELTLEQLIRMRVVEEVSRFNRSPDDAPFRGLVVPTDAELELNGYRLPSGRRIDPDQQVELALSGFRRNRFVVLVDDRQVEDLDEVLHLVAGTEVVFLKLVALQGG